MSKVCWIVLDDVGIEFLQNVYHEGPPSSYVQLPHIELLAAQGMAFVNHYSHPSCTPTRASALTGRTPTDTGLGDFLSPTDPKYLSPTTATIPKLAPNGTRCFHIGKWHLGDHAGAMDPIGHGFAAHAGTRGNLESYTSWTWRQAVPGFSQEHQRTTYSEDDLQADALQVISSLATDPTATHWFVWVALHLPHRPFHYPPGAAQGSGSDLDKYLRMLERADSIVGALRAALPHDAYTFLWSDNGSDAAVASTAGQKAQVKEGGINTPLIVAGPGIPQSTVSTALVCVADHAATTLDLLHGRALDDQTAPAIYAPASISYLGALDYDGAPGQRLRTFSERFQDPTSTELYMAASRSARWKLMRLRNMPNSGQNGERFHDLQTAPPGEDGPDLINSPNLPQDALEELPKLRAVLDSYGESSLMWTP